MMYELQQMEGESNAVNSAAPVSSSGLTLSEDGQPSSGDARFEEGFSISQRIVRKVLAKDVPPAVYDPR
jgi:hypothetical protein